jgi:hypothetical protein
MAQGFVFISVDNITSIGAPHKMAPLQFGLDSAQVKIFSKYRHFEAR